MIPAESVPAERRWRPHTFAAFHAPYFAHVYASGVLWNITRWMGLFLAAFMAADLTDSPLLLQLIGATFFAPFLLGGAVGGMLSDRFDRRLTLISYLFFLIPISVILAAIVLSDAIRIWMLYPFGLIAGLGWVIDITTRRPLIADLVGDELVTNAFSLEATSSSLGGVIGALAGGAIIGLIGIGEAFITMAVLNAVSILSLSRVPPQPPRPWAGASWREDLRAGFAMLPRHRTLVSILGVTIVVNLFFFTFFALVPEVAEDLGVGAFATGVLSAAVTIGATIAAIVIASLPHPPRGRIYVFGSLLALAPLPIFALVDSYAIALTALIVSGLGMGGFGSMQMTLVATSVEEEARGRALGLMSTAIGTLPFGTIALGLIAEPVGVSAALTGSAFAGAVFLALWLLRWPEVLRLP